MIAAVSKQYLIIVINTEAWLGFWLLRKNPFFLKQWTFQARFLYLWSSGFFTLTVGRSKIKILGISPHEDLAVPDIKDNYRKFLMHILDFQQYLLTFILKIFFVGISFLVFYFSGKNCNKYPRPQVSMSEIVFSSLLQFLYLYRLAEST